MKILKLQSLRIKIREIPTNLFLIILFGFGSLALSMNTFAQADGKAPELTLLKRMKTNLQADSLDDRKNCNLAIRAIFTVGRDDYMVAIFGRRENDKSENMSFTIETTVQIISEHGNEPITNNQRELKNDDVAELLNVIDTMELFELPSTRHQKDESEAVFGFAEKWTSESKMSKIIARDLRESRVLDDFFRIIYLLAGKR